MPPRHLRRELPGAAFRVLTKSIYKFSQLVQSHLPVCHPERSEGSLRQHTRCFASRLWRALSMTHRDFVRAVVQSSVHLDYAACVLFGSIIPVWHAASPATSDRDRPAATARPIVSYSATAYNRPKETICARSTAAVHAGQARRVDRPRSVEAAAGVRPSATHTLAVHAPKAAKRAAVQLASTGIGRRQCSIRSSSTCCTGSTKS